MNPPRRILIVRTDRLGDVLLTLPMARAIKIAMPNADVGFYCREYTKPIVERSPDVDEVIVQTDKPSLSGHIRSMRGWDAVFFPNARPDTALAAFLARAPIRVGTAYRYYTALYNKRIREHRKTAERHEAEFNLRMLREIGIDADPAILPSLVLRFEEFQRVEEWKRHEVTSQYAVLHIGSGGSSHAWPRHHWAQLAKELGRDYHIVLTGNAEEAANIDAFIQERCTAGLRISTFVGNGLPELAALLAGAAVVVTGSTGPGHLAAALGTRTIGLYPLPLALSKARWGLRGRNAISIAPPARAACPSCEQCDCMARIDPAAVLAAIS